MSRAHKRRRPPTSRSATATATQPEPGRRDAGQFWWATAIIVGAAVLLRVFFLVEYVSNNPLATRPIIDAATYWEWAGRIAGGQLIGDGPFFSAPLYPYFLGLLRALGAGLSATFLVQIALDGATVVLIGLIGRHYGGPVVGAVAAGIYALMIEPTSFSVRILSSTLQLPLVCLTWLAMLRLHRAPRSARWAALVGLATGAYALTSPPALLLVPVLALIVWGLGKWRWPAAGRAGLMLAASAAVIAPATIHNALATNELIPISAHAGVTLAAGYAPTADGTFGQVLGITPDRAHQNRDAMRRFVEETGRPRSWNAMNRHHIRAVVNGWIEAPRRTLRLAATKLSYFLTGRNYGDIYNPVVERSAGFAATLWLTPIRTAWLIPPALVGLVMWARGRRAAWPAIVLAALPLLVVVLFFYSPRYRFPAVPVLVVAAAWFLVACVRQRRQPLWPAAGVFTLLMGIGTGWINNAAEFDRLARRQAHFYVNLGWCAANDQRWEQAARWYREALRISPDYTPALPRLGAALLNLGQTEAAQEHLEAAAQVYPDDPFTRQQLGRALGMSGHIDAGLAHLRAALAARPDDPDIANDLAAILSRSGDPAAAQAVYEELLARHPDYTRARFNLALILRREGDTAAALRELRTVITEDPTLAPAHYQLGTLLLARGQQDEGLPALRRAVQLAPRDAGTATTLAWYLATLPDLPRADRVAALEMATAINEVTGGASPHVLNTLAAALAVNDRFDEARARVEEAISVAQRQGLMQLVQQFEARRRQYERRQYPTAPPAPVNRGP